MPVVPLLDSVLLRRLCSPQKHVPSQRTTMAATETATTTADMDPSRKLLRPAGAKAGIAAMTLWCRLDNEAGRSYRQLLYNAPGALRAHPCDKLLLSTFQASCTVAKRGIVCSQLQSWGTCEVPRQASSQPARVFVRASFPKMSH